MSKFQSIGILWLRILMGSGMAYHGYGKVFGGMEGFIKAVEKMNFPYPEAFAWAGALAEFGGGIFIVLGLCTRVSAFFVFSTMFVAAFITHGSDPFQVKELALAYLTMAGTLMFTGGGRFSLDNKIF